MLPLVSTGISLERCILVTKRHDLLEIERQERTDRACTFVLIDVTTLVRKQVNTVVTMTNVDAVSKSKTVSVWAEKARKSGRLSELCILGQRDLLY